MSEDGERESRDTSGTGPEPGSVERPKLRRRPFGYKASDVDEVLDARDTELSEMRQDVAALWLAFAQHDRMIRTALEGGRAVGPELSPSPAPPPATPGQAEADIALEASSDADIGRQLSDLDDVLATIEAATRTLERTYADEIAEDGDLRAGPGPEAAPEADAEPDPRAETDVADVAEDEVDDARGPQHEG